MHAQQITCRTLTTTNQGYIFTVVTVMNPNRAVTALQQGICETIGTVDIVQPYLS